MGQCIDQFPEFHEFVEAVEFYAEKFLNLPRFLYKATIDFFLDLLTNGQVAGATRAFPDLTLAIPTDNENDRAVRIFDLFHFVEERSKAYIRAVAGATFRKPFRKLPIFLQR